MSGGKSLIIQGDWIEHYFTKDSYGALHPRKDALLTKAVGERISNLFHADKHLGRDLRKRVFSTDVEFSYRPIGAGPAIAYGVPTFGPSPLKKLAFEGKLSGQNQDRQRKDFLRRCEKRELRIFDYTKRCYDFVNHIEPKDEREAVLKSIEMDQALTGGGYDNTKMFGVSASLFHQLGGAVPELSMGDDEHSRILMEEISKFKEHFGRDCGIAEGSLHITSFDMVRLMQDSDGMIGFPVMAKSSKELTKDIALRISIWSGVDVRSMVKSSVKGISLQGSEQRTAQVVDALVFVFDQLIADPSNPMFANVIWTLARIQRHGYKKEGTDKFVAKDGKSRSVSPGAALSAGPEAMTFDSLLKAMKEGTCPWMPSLQDRETADRLIKDWYEKVLVPKEMRPLPLDWSKWDHHIYGWILATILYYVIRPLYHFDSQKWVDFAIVSLVFKYFLVSEAAIEALPDEWSKVVAINKDQIVEVGEGFVLVGTYDYLGSGAKLTHVGGSLYGELLIHHCIPRLLGYEGVDGPQAGDDTAVAVPVRLIDINDKDKTFDPIVTAAAYWGLEMNAGKQIWAVGAGEVTNIFLQYSYNYNCDIWGVGTGARYYVAAPLAEREKFLVIGEQYLAVISKFNNGWNNPWIRDYIRMWLEYDDFALALFHYKGVGAFDIFVESIGTSIAEVSKRLELTYNWGLTQEQLEKGDIPVLPIIAEVAERMSPKVTLAEALKRLQLQNESIKNKYADYEMIDDVTEATEE